MVFHGKAAPAPSGGLCSEDLEAKPFSHRATEREWVLCDQHFLCDAFFFFQEGGHLGHHLALVGTRPCPWEIFGAFPGPWAQGAPETRAAWGS